jgi:hypothetical protein
MDSNAQVCMALGHMVRRARESSVMGLLMRWHNKMRLFGLYDPKSMMMTRGGRQPHSEARDPQGLTLTA